MSKPDNLRIEDTTATAARADLNDILISIASLQTTDGDGVAYTGEPTTTYPNMFWYDKATSILKLRTTADDAWVNVAYVDQSSNEFRILDDTKVVNTSNTQTGLLGDQPTSTWEAGVGTTESLISPTKLKSAVASARGTAKAWVNFNGSGTIAIRDSENVSSLTDNGTGDYTVNFNNSFGAADYSTTAMPKGTAFFSCLREGVDPTTSAVRVTVRAVDVGFRDTDIVNTTAHGDLA